MYIKVNDNWTEVVNIFKKVNGEFVQINETDAVTYIRSNILKYMGHLETLVLSILSPDNVTSETFTCYGYANNTRLLSGTTWEIISGSSYASVNSSSGVVSISSNANNSIIRIRLTYQGNTVEKDITVTYKSGAASNTEQTEVDNGDGTTSITQTTTTDNGDGSSTSSSTTTNYDESGNVTGSSYNETQNNADGSSSSVTTNYDATGTETGHVNENTDTSGNTKTQTVEKDENGNDEITGYVIDTSKNENGGLNEVNIDTGVLALDGTGFDIHMVYTLTMKNQGNNPYKTILAAIQSDGNNKYIGFTMKTYGQYQLGLYSASSYSSFSNQGALGYRLGNEYLRVPKARTTFTLDFSYRPNNGSSNGGTVDVSISPSSTGSGNDSQNTPATMNATNNYIPNQLDNASIHIGGCGISKYDAIDMEILEFTVTKVK